jgi:hypothetical protein
MSGVPITHLLLAAFIKGCKREQLEKIIWGMVTQEQEKEDGT